MAKQRVVVVGGGLAGLAASMRLAEAEVQVDLVSSVPVKRSHSVCAQGGINYANPVTKQQGDSEWKHFDDTVYGGDFLQHQPPVKEMCEWAPRVIDLLDRLGVPFNRAADGHRAHRRFGGTLYERTAFAGATTGQQLIYALDEQVRRWEVEGRVTKYEFWDFLKPILDDNGVCRGAVVMDMMSMEIRSLPADAVVLATGGCGLIFGRSTMSMNSTGSANSRAYQAGVRYANGEFIQVHPTAIPGVDKLRLMSESARGEGGRVWVPRQPGDTRGPRDIPESERWYFLEERYPTYGNLVPRDIATREIFSVCREGFSVDPDAYCVYLDLTHIDRAELDRKLMGILEIYEKFQGVDPRVEPMKIFPAVHYSMGGLWCAFEKDEATGGLNVGSPRNQLTNVPGLYAIGEADYQYHGGNRLGANSLLSCIFSGLIVAPGIVHHLKNLPHGGVGDQPASRFDGAAAACKRHYDDLVNNDGGENPYELHMTLGDEMTRNVTVVRNNRDLEATVTKIQELQERFKKVTVPDKSGWTNQPVVYTWALGDMLVLAEVIAQGALLRNECRGAHYKPAFDMPKMDADEPVELRRQARRWCDAFGKKNEQWLKSTVAEHTPDGPRICYEAVDVSLIPPRPRTYGLVGAEVIEQTWREATASVVEPKTEAATAS